MGVEKGKFQRGFKHVRKKIDSNKGLIRCVRECSTCDCNKGLNTVTCTNPNVTSFDMTVEEGGKQYCTFWRPVGYKPD